MRKMLVFLLLVWLTASPAMADTVFVRNQRFPGPTSGSGDRLYVGLEDLARLTGLNLQPVEQGWYVSAEPTTDPARLALVSEPGAVVVEGERVDSLRHPSGAVLVNLAQFGRASGLHVSFNRQMGTVDVTLPRDFKGHPPELTTQTSPDEAASAAPSTSSADWGAADGQPSTAPPPVKSSGKKKSGGKPKGKKPSPELTPFANFPDGMITGTPGGILAPEGAPLEAATDGGKAVDLAPYLQVGRMTLVYYYVPGHYKNGNSDQLITQLASTYPKKLAIVRVNVGFEGSDLARKYNAWSLPALALFDTGGHYRGCVGRGHSTNGQLSNYLRKLPRL